MRDKKKKKCTKNTQKTFFYISTDWKRYEPKKNEITGEAVAEFENLKSKLLFNETEKQAAIAFKTDDCFKRIKKRYKGVKVICVETQEIFPTIAAAAKKLNVRPSAINASMARGYRIKKLTFKRLDDGNNGNDTCGT